jgi:hypothetical protein
MVLGTVVLLMTVMLVASAGELKDSQEPAGQQK